MKRTPTSTTVIRAAAVAASFAIAMYLLHHQLQIVYFRTCKANLLTVVLHHRSDVCYALNMAISGIERVYQQGIVTLIQWGASAAAIMLPYAFSSSRAPTPANDRACAVDPSTTPDDYPAPDYRRWWLPSSWGDAALAHAKARAKAQVQVKGRVKA